MLNRLPIRIQLTAITASVTLITLIASFALFMWHDLNLLQKDMVSDAKRVAETIASNSGAPLTFGDGKAAQEVLDTLRFTPEVDEAGLYTKDGKVLATFQRTKGVLTAMPPAPQAESFEFRGDHFESRFPVQVGKDRVGSLFIRSNMNAWYDHRDTCIEFLAILALVAVSFAALLGFSLQSRISRPILDLVQTMKEVRERNDYSLRIHYVSQDEIGQTVAGFNAMLAEIESKDAALQLAKDELEDRVAQRTRELELAVQERKAKEQQLAEFFESTPSGIMMIDAEGCISAANRSQLAMLGYESVEVLGKSLGQLGLSGPGADQLLSRLMAGEILWNQDYSILTKDGCVRSIQVNAGAHFVAGVFAHAGLFTRDTTIQKAAEHAELARERAERANIAKSEFLSRMSHELRTPLNAVIGFAQLLQMQSDDSETLESADSILKAGRHLLDLVNEVLDLSRIEAGKLTLSLEPVAVTAAIAQAVELVRPTAQGLGIAIGITSDHGDDLHVMADRQRLVQVLINLITNAAKYNRPNGRIDIRCVHLDDGRYRIEIQDTGLGIDESGLNRLFVPFERLGNQQAEGTGLGLALSRRLTELMEGQLFLLHTGAEGSTFAIDLNSADAPCIESSKIESQMSEVAPDVEKLLRLVYIEDNLSNLQLLEKVFEKIGGIEFIPAMLASTGLQLVEDHLPDLVLLDLHLPDAHGINVLEKLKAKAKTASIPVIVLSADATESQVHRLLSAGAASYLTKPLDLPLLFAELKKLKPGQGNAA